jgi:hypothetical protein
MATQTLTNCKIYVAGFDLSGDLNAVALDYGADMLDGTTFGQTTRINVGGLKTTVAKCEGLYDVDGTDEPDDVIYSRIGTANVPVSICPTTGAVGEVAYLFRSVHTEYSVGGAIGDLLPFSVGAEGSDGAPPIRGYVMQASGSVTADANGTAVQLGAVSATQRLYGSLHVLSASAGDTLDITVESDTASNFPSATTVLTFGQLTTAGESDWQSVAGAITDTWYRIAINVGGVGPDFSFVVTLGIA